MKVALYVMTFKGLQALGGAVDAGVEISHVVTAPARGMNDFNDRVISDWCKELGIPVFVRGAPPVYQADVSIAAGWRWMLDVPQLVVLHDSLLPRYRGFSPMVTALVNGESEIGVTAFLARDVPDTGPIVAQRSLPVSYPARAKDVIDRLGPLYRQLSAEVCATVKAGESLRAAEQDHQRATFSVWRDDTDYRIDWSRDDRRIVRLINAVSDPFPGAWTTAAGNETRVLEAVSEPDVAIEDRCPGKVAYVRDGQPVVVCGTGLVRITDPQFADTPLKTRFT